MKDMEDNNNSEINNSEINLSKPNNIFILNSYNIQDKIQQLIKNDENQNVNKIVTTRTSDNEKKANFF